MSAWEEPYGASYDLYGYERFEVDVPRYRRRIVPDEWRARLGW